MRTLGLVWDGIVKNMRNLSQCLALCHTEIASPVASQEAVFYDIGLNARLGSKKHQGTK